ncbi:MAG TPA: hypothetical protein VFG12_08540 [Rhodopila sp.]|nr:hypothetical protein [Rhodopila sp.]
MAAEQGAIVRHAPHAWSMLADDACAAGHEEQAKACVDLAYWAYDAANPRERPGVLDDDGTDAAWPYRGDGGDGGRGLPVATTRPGGDAEDGGRGRVVSLHRGRKGGETD